VYTIYSGNTDNPRDRILQYFVMSNRKPWVVIDCLPSKGSRGLSVLEKVFLLPTSDELSHVPIVRPGSNSLENCAAA